ncbi:MAG: general secretion pathway protein GspB [Amphritea sp.]
MSYILDALKKSEQERGSQQTPGLDAALSEKSPLRCSKPAWIWLIPLLLGLNILLLLWPNDQAIQEIKAAPSDNVASINKLPAEPEPQQPAVENSKQDHQPVEVTSALDVTALTPSEQALLAAEPINYHRDPFAPLPRHITEALKVSEASTEFTETETPTVAIEKRSPRRLTSTDLATLNQSLFNHVIIKKLPSLQEEQPLPPDSTPLSTRQTAEPLAKQTKQIPEFQELGEEQRKEIAPLNMSVHIYATKATDRMARINGIMVPEGHQFSEQLKLLEITPNGSIFSYKGQRFQIKR